MYLKALLVFIGFLIIVFAVSLAPVEPIKTRPDIVEYLLPKAQPGESPVAFELRRENLRKEFNTLVGNHAFSAGEVILEQYKEEDHLIYVNFIWEKWANSLAGQSETGVISAPPEIANQLWKERTRYPLYIQVPLTEELTVEKQIILAQDQSFQIYSPGLWQSKHDISYKTVQAHKDKIVDIKFDITNQYLLSASQDGFAKRLKTSNWRSANTFKHANPLNVLSLTDDYFTTISLEGELFFWSLTGEQLFRSIEPNIVKAIAFSDNSSLFATAGNDGSILIRESESKSTLHRLTGHTDWIRSLVFTPDNNILYSAGDDLDIRIWNVYQGELKGVITAAHQDTILDLAIHPQGSYLASASADKTVKIWSTSNNQLIYTFEHSDRVNRVTFSRDGNLIASITDDGKVSLWATLSGKLMTTLEAGTPLYSIDIARDMSKIVAGDNKGDLHIWDISSQDL